MDLSSGSAGRVGRYCALRGITELTPEQLTAGLDFRLPQHRRAVFLRAYEFHLKYGTMPGCVYFLFPWLATHYGWTQEQKLWFAFLNGNTQNPVTSWLIFRQFPAVDRLDELELGRWFVAQYARLEFDTDRRYHKKNFLRAVAGYLLMIGRGTQRTLFEGILQSSDAQENYRQLWGRTKSFYSFGRLSMFSYSEYLRIMGLPIECDQLFLHDLEGSKSHRNGLCKVLGRDDLDWHDSNPAFTGYSQDVLQWLRQEGALLLQEARERCAGQPYAASVSYETLESQLCNYKSWYRPNRRYPNVYADMLHGRIRRAEAVWGESLDLFWQARRESLPLHLRLEDTPRDPGVHPSKQNHFRLTGEVIMMDGDWPCFANRYNQAVATDRMRTGQVERLGWLFSDEVVPSSGLDHFFL